MVWYAGTRKVKITHCNETFSGRYCYVDTGEPVPPGIELTTHPEGGAEATESPEPTNYLIQFSFVMDGRLASVTFLPISIDPTVRVSGQVFGFSATVVQDTPSLTLAVERVKDFVAKGGAKGLSPERVEAMLNGMAEIL